MKALLLFFVLLSGAVCASASDAVFVAPLPKKTEMQEFPVEPKAKGFQGIVAQLLRVAKPLQLINPFAPSYYGSGEQNVTPASEFSQPYPNPPGLVVFGIER